MKILFYINAIHHGGAERVMCNLATQFSEHGHTCVLVTSFRDEWEYPFGEKVQRITLFETQIKQGFWKRNLSLVKALRKVLREEKPDILVSFMAEPNFRAIVASLGLKNKVIVSVRNDPNREYRGRLNRFLAKTLFRLADGVVFQTEEAQKWFPKAIRKKSRIIFNQVDEVFYRTVYDGERHDIVTTGRLTAQKNHKMLIHAFAMIADRIPDNLVIYGEGELRGELEALVAELHLKDRIFLPGSITDVANTIRSAKLFVLSSDYEGMPNSLMEAMALGLPCLSTDCPCGGPRMLFGESMGKCLVPIRDPHPLSCKMLQSLCHPEEAGATMQFAQKQAEMFSPYRIFRTWNDFLCDVQKLSMKKGG